MAYSLPRQFLILLLMFSSAIPCHSGAQTQPLSGRTEPAGAHTQHSGRQSKSKPAASQSKPGGTQKQRDNTQTGSASAQGRSAGKQSQPATVQTRPEGPRNQLATAQNQSLQNSQTQIAGTEKQPGVQVQPENVQIPQIISVHVFEAAEAPKEQGTFYMEITGRYLPTAGPAVFLAPHEGLADHTTQVISATTSLMVAKFSASRRYFPSSVAVAGTGVVSNTFDVPKNANVDSTLPRIDDIEILQLNRTTGIARIKIDGANFGSDPSKVSVVIVPREPGLPAFAIVPPELWTDGQTYICPNATPDQMNTPPSAEVVKNDVVVVNFSFVCKVGYSTPFVIARVVLTVSGADGRPAGSASYEMLPARDKNLIYRSTILSSDQARSRFGGGIAENFYVVQLSVVNQGPSKVQIPLASIQAEVEWYAGAFEGKFYVAGPATVAPVPLAGAVSYFSTYRQATGPRAKFFNSLQGLTTIGSAIQLFFGPGFAQGVGIAGGGFRQGLGQIYQDISDQQLANLTSQSFESIEVVSGNGGSLEKVIFIQRGEEKLPSSLRRLITNIEGFEITGYEVPQTAAISGTPKS